MDDGLIYAEAGVACPKVARFAADARTSAGAEFLAGIPGTVGGALAMNAGCYGGETWDIVERVVTINRRGQLRAPRRDEFDIGYRHCALKTDASATATNGSPRRSSGCPTATAKSRAPS